MAQAQLATANRNDPNGVYVSQTHLQYAAAQLDTALHVWVTDVRGSPPPAVRSAQVAFFWLTYTRYYNGSADQQVSGGRGDTWGRVWQPARVFGQRPRIVECGRGMPLAVKRLGWCPWANNLAPHVSAGLHAACDQGTHVHDGCKRALRC